MLKFAQASVALPAGPYLAGAVWVVRPVTACPAVPTRQRHPRAHPPRGAADCLCMMCLPGLVLALTAEMETDLCRHLCCSACRSLSQSQATSTSGRSRASGAPSTGGARSGSKTTPSQRCSRPLRTLCLHAAHLPPAAASACAWSLPFGVPCVPVRGLLFVTQGQSCNAIPVTVLAGVP